MEVGSTKVTQRAALRRRAVRGAGMFKHQGLCAANLQGEALDLDAPKELINLDTMHKASTGRRVDAISYGRFSTAPRGEGCTHAVPHASAAPTLTPSPRRMRADFFMAKAVKRSNESLPAKILLDPYHVSDGNLWTKNFQMDRFQRGGMCAPTSELSQLPHLARLGGVKP